MAWKEIPEKKVLAEIKDKKEFKGQAAENITLYIEGGVPGGDDAVGSISMTVDPNTYVMTTQLKNKKGEDVGSPATVDLPLESMVVGGEYDDATKKVILTLKNGETVEFSVADLVAGLQSEITPSNPLSADLVAEAVNKEFVTHSEKMILEQLDGGGVNDLARLFQSGNETRLDSRNEDEIHFIMESQGGVEQTGLIVVTPTGRVNLGQGFSGDINPRNFGNECDAEDMREGTYSYDPVGGTDLYIDGAHTVQVTEAGTLIVGGASNDGQTVLFIPGDGSAIKTYHIPYPSGEVEEKSIGSGNVGRYLTSDDCNWNSQTKTATEPYNAVALWLMEPGIYLNTPNNTGFSVFTTRDNSEPSGGTFFVMNKGSNGTENELATILYTSGLNPGIQVVNVNKNDGSSYFGTRTLITSEDVANNLVSVSSTTPLAANQGRVLNEKIGDLSSLPTTDKSSLVNALIEVANGGSIKTLTDADANWTDPDSGDEMIALWLLPTGTYRLSSDATVVAAAGLNTDGEETWIDTSFEKAVEPLFVIQNEDVLTGGLAGITVIYGGGGGVWLVDTTSGLMNKDDSGSFLPGIYGLGTYTEPGLVPGYWDESNEYMYLGRDGWTYWQNADWTDNNVSSPNYILNKPTIPSKVSDLTNDSGYQTASQVSSAIASAVGGITSFEYEVVQTLPATGEAGKIYLVANSGATPNIYDEYIYVSNAFEKIGTTEMDLSNYPTKSEMNTALAGKVDAVDPSDLPSGAYQGSVVVTNDKENIDPSSVEEGQIVVDPTTNIVYVISKETEPGSSTETLVFTEVGKEQVVFLPMTITNLQALTFSMENTVAEINAMINAGMSVFYRLVLPQDVGSLRAGTYDFRPFYSSNVVIMCSMLGASSSNTIMGLAWHTASGTPYLEMRSLQSQINSSNKLSADLIDSSNSDDKTYQTGTGAPTTSTAGSVGEMYVDKSTGTVYVCTSTTGGTYTWNEVSGGDSGAVITMTTTDPGEGATLEANHFIAVYEA